jgi:hypothetical protein
VSFVLNSPVFRDRDVIHVRRTQSPQEAGSKAMMNFKCRGVLVLSGLSATAAYSAQPPDSVTSDAYNNTAMGNAMR